jgi:hypothetical protein
MQIETDHQRRAISFADMKTFLAIGWGDLGVNVAEAWRALNKKHFGNALEPIPIILVNTSPYGRWLGCTFCNVKRKRAHLIQLTVPRAHDVLLADHGILLHEMLHQHLTEQGDSPKHSSAAWCEGVMRLHFEVTGKRIWCAPETVAKATDRDPVTGKRRSIRVQSRDPATGKPSLDQDVIATWPRSLELPFPPF